MEFKKSSKAELLIALAAVQTANNGLTGKEHLHRKATELTKSILDTIEEGRDYE